VAQTRSVDESFLALPLSALADAALTRAVDLGCEHADLRVERIRTQSVRLRDARLEALGDGEDLGLAVRVVHEGTWGFAAGVVLTAAEAVRLAEEAVAVAQVSAAMNTDRVELAPEPVHADGEWVSAYEVDPFAVPDAEKTGLLVELSEQLLAADGVEHVQTSVLQVKEQKFYADTAGTRTRQQRVRVHPEITALTVDRTTGTFESMRTLAPPVGRGWEFLTGNGAGDGWDWRGELAEIPELLREKVAAPSVDAGRYDLVVDPSNLWLTIHESIGHATELDRALGYEAAYAGTSFATVDKLGTLQYGSPLMDVTGDRTAEHGLSTVGWDDEGVAGQQWDLIRDGVLVGYQVDRNMARLRGLPRSNGCAFADSAAHVPVQRMANVSLQPIPDGPSTEEIIAGVERGIYVVGDNSWSIDMQRYNFQFTGQRFYRIEGGQLSGQLRDVAYQATTTDFWGSMTAVGGPQTYVLGGAFNCGKAQPGQVAPVSHGCPTALFENTTILNTKQEGGR
jgi:TldD protein